ncbi:MAG: hypothetical protein VXX21_09160, partial [Pseudomonadota bacterium]|nr:hypothetical protein [Pseudomonadota bacterium]
SRADWRGRIRASRGIGGSLSNDEVAAFDNAYNQLLQRIAGEEFTILLPIDAHRLRAEQPDNTERFYRQ